jgi:histidinol-phosphatase
MSPRLAFALDAAVMAGRSTLAHFQNGVVFESKQDDTPVTIADKNAERIIRERIEKQYPAEAILGEEEGMAGVGDDRWVIDPIDGTKSFICGVPLYATLLSYEKAGEPEIGVCYFPALDDLIYAERGQGAFWNGRPCHVSSRTTLKGAVIASSGYLGLTKRGLMPAYTKMAEESMAARTWCDAYGHALVATGRVDLMIDSLVSRWDISAMAVIVREAGGRFTDLFGSETLGDNALSSNGALHEELLEALKT